MNLKILFPEETVTRYVGSEICLYNMIVINVDAFYTCLERLIGRAFQKRPTTLNSGINPSTPN